MFVNPRWTSVTLKFLDWWPEKCLQCGPLPSCPSNAAIQIACKGPLVRHLKARTYIAIQACAFLSVQCRGQDIFRTDVYVLVWRSERTSKKCCKAYLKRHSSCPMSIYNRVFRWKSTRWFQLLSFLKAFATASVTNHSRKRRGMIFEELEASMLVEFAAPTQQPSKRSDWAWRLQSATCV